jgi:hypothetical protein
MINYKPISVGHREWTPSNASIVICVAHFNQILPANLKAMPAEEANQTK